MTSYEGPIRRVDGTSRGKPTHWYEDINGRKIDGVTTILSKGLPKPALLPWGIKAVAEYAVNNREDLAGLPPTEMLKELKGAPYKERDAAAKRGTEVHKIAESLIRGEAVTVPAEIDQHVKHYIEFLDTFQPDPLLIEVVVYHLEYGYAGTLDFIAEVGSDKQVWLFDIKTGKGVYSDVAYQLAAYRHATHYVDESGTPRPMPHIDQAAVVHVTDKGWSVIPVATDEGVLKAFRHISVVARETETNGVYLGQPLDGVA